MAADKGGCGARAALEAAIELASDLGDRIVIAFGYEPPGDVGEELTAARAADRPVLAVPRPSTNVQRRPRGCIAERNNQPTFLHPNGLDPLLHGLEPV